MEWWQVALIIWVMGTWIFYLRYSFLFDKTAIRYNPKFAEFKQAHKYRYLMAHIICFVIMPIVGILYIPFFFANYKRIKEEYLT